MGVAAVPRCPEASDGFWRQTTARSVQTSAPISHQLVPVAFGGWVWSKPSSRQSAACGETGDGSRGGRAGETWAASARLSEKNDCCQW